MSSGESLVLTFSLLSGTGSSLIKMGSVIIAQAFNGNQGRAFDDTGAGASINNTPGIGDTSYCSWYNTYGTAGASSSGTDNITAPNMSGGKGCPKGDSSWNQGGSGMAQREPSNPQGKGYVLITYHLG
jgi:hypothetical protein